MFEFYFQLTAYGFSVMLDHWMVTLKSELSKANLPALDLDDNSPLEEHVLSPRFDEDKVAEQLSAVVIEEKSNLNSNDVTNVIKSQEIVASDKQISVLLAASSTNVNGSEEISSSFDAKKPCDVTAINHPSIPPVHTLPDEISCETIAKTETVESAQTEKVLNESAPGEILTEKTVESSDNPVDPSQMPANSTHELVNPSDVPVNSSDLPVNPSDLPVKPQDLLVNAVQEVNPSDLPLADTDEEDEFHETKREEVI